MNRIPQGRPRAKKRPALTIQRAQLLRQLANFAEAQLEQLELYPQQARDSRARRANLRRGIKYIRALAEHRFRKGTNTEARRKDAA